MLEQNVYPFIVFAAALAIALVIRQFVVLFLHRKVAGDSRHAISLLRSIRIPSVLWCFAAALAVALRFAPLTERQVDLATRWIGAFLIISVSLAAANILVRVFAAYGERNSMPFAVAGLSRTLINVVVLGVGTLVLLRHFNVSITPILTALGVGGLAVALALQDTLANFFAGVHILVEAPINVGDFIRLSTGEEGVVSDIGWRTTRLSVGGHSTIVIPNTKITTGTLTNFNLPDARVTMEILILAGLDADAGDVAGLAMDVAEKAQGVLDDPPPAVMFDPGVLATHMQMKLMVTVATPAARGPVASAIRAALLEGFRQRGIPLPDLRRQV